MYINQVRNDTCTYIVIKNLQHEGSLKKTGLHTFGIYLGPCNNCNLNYYSESHKINIKKEVKPWSQEWLIAAGAYPRFCSMKRLEDYFYFPWLRC